MGNFEYSEKKLTEDCVNLEPVLAPIEQLPRLYFSTLDFGCLRAFWRWRASTAISPSPGTWLRHARTVPKLKRHS